MFRITNKKHQEAIDIAASARRYKAQVQEGLAAKLIGLLQEGESLPDLAFFQEVIGRLLEKGSAGVLEVDRRHTEELTGTAGLRVQRNQLVARLRDRLQEVRFRVDRSVDKSVAKTALRERRVSAVTPNLLVSGARDLAILLRNPDHAWDGNGVFGPAAEVAAMLEADAAQLEGLLRRLAPQKEASQDELAAKKAEVAAVTEANRRCVDALFGLYRLAGLDVHANRLRAKVRRRKTEEPEETPPAPPDKALMRID